MTRMIACVRGPHEVGIALAGGVDAIDVAQTPDIVQRVVDAADGRRPVIAAASHATAEAAGALAACGVDTVRIPLDCDDPAPGLAAMAALRGRVTLLATLPADRARDGGLDTVLPMLKTAGFAGALLDVAGPGERLLGCVPMLLLGRFVAACRAHGLQPGLAGGLESPDVPRLLLMEPEMLLFAAALRDEDGELDRALVRLIRGQIPPDLADGADYRLLAGRGPAPRGEGDPTPGDRIFVHDLVLPVQIGAYAHERLAPQPVRFNVDAVVTHARNPADLRDVMSYDIISDGIRLLVAAGHVPLVETLAERIATMLLAHPRVVRVMIRLEKLEAGAGIVGVAIERSRPTRAALSPSEEQRTR